MGMGQLHLTMDQVDSTFSPNQLDLTFSLGQLGPNFGSCELNL